MLGADPGAPCHRYQGHRCDREPSTIHHVATCPHCSSPSVVSIVGPLAINARRARHADSSWIETASQTAGAAARSFFSKKATYWGLRRPAVRRGREARAANVERPLCLRLQRGCGVRA
jgi:hypothetical protein